MPPHSDTGIRLALWSGPRNISTAMMRAWDSRGDTFVCDEPLYACYLQATGADHPGREEILAHHETDWRTVIAELVGPIPEGKAIFYQKQMAHHLVGLRPGSGTDITHYFFWIGRITGLDEFIAIQRFAVNDQLVVLPQLFTNLMNAGTEFCAF